MNPLSPTPSAAASKRSVQQTHTKQLRYLTVSALMLMTVLITLLSLLPSSASAQVQVQGSVGGQLAPGVYGRVDFGSGPAPAVIYQRPVYVANYVQQAYPPAPIYLSVPPGHSRNRNQWHRYCARYDACGQPVYFVRPAYYKPARAVRVHHPVYRSNYHHTEQPAYWVKDKHHKGHGKGHGKEHGKGHNKHGHND